ncbi:MAG: hypothetical protein A3E98_03550 [Candidatus Doudnabacteria bacterium RIFCSPHIGHO2_12_FULL_48_11]|uniref:Uncharacterized protein n=1 Tax=Candidatus Doudnabacteria bacterium RIFCSPHIGHO2_01_FULL_46_24 TaxID=1817825 RepID=A0A1F5NSX7_9BACT|nr:MAG: hypothetical protein A2720_04415 [Candidatus Doudnabacteria bacterium RIFCSPHIGHO2_01_FULL_46_24]OGE96153.1 MAG: hypothetical protein A3E98_03550 [Candidatus Doudnabacteria bacterium RIFCSPHIGHO2_12_FULL_48_11]
MPEARRFEPNNRDLEIEQLKRDLSSFGIQLEAATEQSETNYEQMSPDEIITRLVEQGAEFGPDLRKALKRALAGLGGAMVNVSNKSIRVLL